MKKIILISSLACLSIFAAVFVGCSKNEKINELEPKLLKS